LEHQPRSVRSHSGLRNYQMSVVWLPFARALKHLVAVHVLPLAFRELLRQSRGTHHLGLLTPEADDDRPTVPVFLLPPGARVETKKKPPRKR
jgi:hypothetical protein